MECVIPGLNLKVMVKAIQALAKIGEELYLNAKPENLSLMTINSSRTAYVTFNLLDTFFSSYSLSDSYSENMEGCICKISMKAIAGIFKGHKEKSVDICKMQLNSEETNLTITFKYRYDATVVHNLHLSEPETLSIVIPENDDFNQISATSTYFNQLLMMFQPYDEDISWEFTKTKATVRNYDPRAMSTQKSTRTQIALNATEFTLYKINQETSITFPSKPFRSAVQFADNFHLNITIKFETTGKPGVFVMNNPTFELSFVVATLRPEGTTQSTVTSTPSVRRPIKQKKQNVNVTIEDQAALESVNWDDDFNANKDGSKNKSNFVDILKDLREKRGEKQSSTGGAENGSNKDEEDVIPESPRAKLLKIVFERCLQSPFDLSQFNKEDVLVENSDPDSDMEVD